MKTNAKPKWLFSSLLLVILVVCQASYGQDTEADPDISLKAEHNQLIRKERELLNENRTALKQTLTNEQIAILRNTDLSLKAKRRQLNRSFTADQKALINNQRLRMNRIRAPYKSTLSEEQWQLLKERLLRRFRNFRDRAELRHRARLNSSGN